MEHTLDPLPQFPFDSTPLPAQPAPQYLRFHASGSEYFRIWIVNLLLTIVTLGIYSAWAKVRRNQYFYASTELAGSSFEYHGKPLAILKGRIVALVLFGGYNLALKFSLALGGAIGLLLLVVMPWLIWKSLQFSLYNSSYRGIRFGFDGSAGGAYLHYLGWPLLNVVTLGLLSPFVHQRLKRFQHTESRFGTSHFSFDGSVGSFYKRYALFLLIGLGGCVALATLLVMLARMPSSQGMMLTMRAAYVPIAVMGVVYLWLFMVVPLFLAMIQNLIWNHTGLGPHRFRSDMRWGRLTFITLTNYLAIICTLGLFLPFARVRSMRYRIESTALLPAGSLDDFVAATAEQVSATGVGMADLMDFDLSM